jgi:outer membrane protein W
MKINIKYYVIGILLFFVSTSVSAQRSGMWHFQYDMGVPLGNTSDFVSNFSPRGFALEGQGYVSENFSVGGRIAWNVFYEDTGWTLETINPKSGDVGAGGESIDVYAYRKHYMNIMPLMVTGHYTFNSNKVIPYIGAGIGTYYIHQRNQVGIYIFDTDQWHFGVAPEAGIVIPFGQGSNWGVDINVRYNFAVKTKNYDSQTWLNTSVGLTYFW